MTGVISFTWHQTADTDTLLKLTQQMCVNRSFAVQGPRTWNSPPAVLRAPDISVETFRHKLKTFLFAV